MKILTSQEMRAADEATFSKLALPSRVVMESAGRAVAMLVAERFADVLNRGVLVLAGRGNNGGDGFVVARSLSLLGVRCEVVLLGRVRDLKGDARANAESWSAVGGGITEAEEESWNAAQMSKRAREFGLFVDAIFGTSFSGPVRGFSGRIIEWLNEISSECASPVVAVDIPSGVESDSGRVSGPAVRAELTVALQAPKLGHVLFPGSQYSGEIWVADIGIRLDAENSPDRELVLFEQAAAMAAAVYNEDVDTHKGRRGRVLVIGGGRGHVGAAVMSAKAALVTGAGLVTVGLPQKAFDAAAPGLMELMAIGFEDNGEGDFSEKACEALPTALSGVTALVIGPGLGSGEGARALLAEALRTVRCEGIPCILDADALTLLAARRELGESLFSHVILTPHPGEMGRLLGCPPSVVQADRLHAAQRAAAQYGCPVVLKGARSIVAFPAGAVRVNPAAVSALATAGAGDVLAGMLGALVARGADLQVAATLGVFAHGLAGEMLAERTGKGFGVLARDIIAMLPQVLNLLVGQAGVKRSFCRRILPGSLGESVFFEV